MHGPQYLLSTATQLVEDAVVVCSIYDYPPVCNVHPYLNISTISAMEAATTLPRTLNFPLDENEVLVATNSHQDRLQIFASLAGCWTMPDEAKEKTEAMLHDTTYM